MMSKSELEHYDAQIKRQRFWLLHQIPPIYRYEINFFNQISGETL